MKKLTASCIAILFMLFAHSQNPNLKWVKRTGGTSRDIAKAINTDSSGNIYLAGIFSRTVDFDPGPGTYNLDAARDGIFISKSDSSGNLIWARCFRNNTKFSGTDITSISTDASGNVYTTGEFTDTMDFDPGIDSFKLYSPGRTDIFISKLDPLGNFVWARQFEGSCCLSISNSLNLDDSANIYLTGNFWGSVDFDPGPIVNTLSTFTNDIFVCKLDSSGKLKWVKQFVGKGWDLSYTAELDKSNQIYLAGHFQDTCDFDPGPGKFKLISFGKEDGFIMKLNASGDLIWIKQFGGTGADRGLALKLDYSGHIYLAGRFDSIAEFNPGGVSHKDTANGYSDLFIARFDTSGNFEWVKTAGGKYDDEVKKLAVDRNNSIYAIGVFQDKADFDPGAGIDTISSKGGRDIFITKEDSAGNHKWTRAFGDISQDDGMGILFDRWGNIITTGGFTGSVDFDPGPAVFNLSSASPYSSDIFIHKMKQCSPSSSVIHVSNCDSVKVNSQVYKSTGTYFQTEVNSTGCDSSITIFADILKSSTNAITDTACDSIRINNITFRSSGIYKQKFNNAMGCDSILTLNLTIKKSGQLQMNASGCEEYTLNGQVYQTTGTYVQHLVSKSGCDSTIIVHLSIINIDTTVSNGGKTLTANTSVAFYQWIDCNTSTAIPGAIFRSFIPDRNGKFAVIITKNGCIDTSSCHTITGIGINSMTDQEAIKVFPNPAYDKLNIQFSGENAETAIRLYSSTGQLILEKNSPHQKSFVLDLTEIARGFYILEVVYNGEVFQSRIIKSSPY
jgi:hypothetical protein